MVKLVAMLRRPFGVSAEEFQRWWFEEHVPRVKKYPGLRKYVISTTTDSVLGEPVFDGIAELWFDDLPTAEGAVSSAAALAGHRDTVSHTEIEVRMITVEHVVDLTPQVTTHDGHIGASR